MHNMNENEVLRDALSRLNEDVPPMPEHLHAAWMQKVEDDMEDSRIEKTRTRRSLTRFLSVAAAMVFVVGGTLLTKDRLDSAIFRNTSAPQSDTGGAFLGAAYANGYNANSYDEDGMELAEEEFAMDIADAAPAAMKLTSSRGAAGGSALTDPIAVPTEKKIIRTASLTIATQTFADSLNALKTSCEGQGGWIESVSENVNSYSGLRTAYLTLRIPQSGLDTYLAGTENLGRVTSRSESAQDVTASYQDTRTRLNTQLALMDRLQALITESGDLSDLLALESQIADTQYQIDTLQSALNSTDRQVSYSTVSVTLREEKNVELTDASVSFWDRIVSAIRVGLESFIGFLGDMVVFLVAALPYIAIVMITVIMIKLIKKRRK